MTIREQPECLPHAALDKHIAVHNNREKQAKGCIADAYALQILFVYFLTPSLLHPLILLFFILVVIRDEQLMIPMSASLRIYHNCNIESNYLLIATVKRLATS